MIIKGGFLTMGTKRIGLARIEALMENLKRDINWQNATSQNLVLRKVAGGVGAQGPTAVVVGKNGGAGILAGGAGAADPFTESATQHFDFGTLLHYGDRIFRYAGIGGTAVTAGKCLQAAPLVNANHRDMAVQAGVAAGLTSVPVTFGGDTDAAENLYAEGYLHINDGAGQGQLMRIKSHAAVDAGVSTTCTLKLYDKVVTAVTTSSKADLITAPYNDLVVAPAAETGPVVGVTVIDMTADYYGWVQVSGPCSVLTVGTVVLGNHAVRSGGTDGGVAPATDDLLQNLGAVMVVNGNTDNSVIWLNLEG